MRPRKHNKHLPARMYFKNGRFWYVNDKWNKLSKDYSTALVEYASYVSATGNSVSALVDKYQIEKAIKHKPSTQKEYKRLGEIVKKAFQEFHDAMLVEPHHIAQVLDDEAKKNPTQSNRMRQFMSVVFTFAVRKGLLRLNPVKEVKGVKVEKRDRYITDDEFFLVQKSASLFISVLMDILYITAQRIGDVLKIKRSDLAEEGIYFEQQKTGKRLLIEWTPELRDAVSRAISLHDKESVKGITLFYGRGGKPYTYFGVRSMFVRYCLKAGVKDFGLHDIRSKSITDARNQGLDAQRLAGHHNQGTTDGYIKLREVEAVTPPRLPKPKKY